MFRLKRPVAMYMGKSGRAEVLLVAVACPVARGPLCVAVCGPCIPTCLEE